MISEWKVLRKEDARSKPERIGQWTDEMPVNIKTRFFK